MSSPQSAPQAALQLARSPGFAAAFTVATIGALLSTHALRSVMGDVGYGTIIVGLVVLGAIILLARRGEWRITQLVPITLVIVMVWFAVSATWSMAPLATVGAWLQLAAPTFLAVVIAQTRENVQIVRATADVLRWLLSLSLALEILSGILLDLPIAFLGIAGDITSGGPIQGIFGTRTQLGLVTILALITFLVEWRTRLVPSGLTTYSLAVALILAIFTASPIVLILAAITTAAAAILAFSRRVPAHTRRQLHVAMASLVAIGLVLGYAFRRPLVYWLNAEPDFFTRSELWNSILDASARTPTFGTGFFGTWPDRVVTYILIRYDTDTTHDSALSAYMDVLLQVGAIGLVLFGVYVAMTLATTWSNAATKRSTVYTWSPLVVLVLLCDGVVTSNILGGYGWFFLALCAARAAQMRWQSRTTADADLTGPIDLPPEPLKP